MEKTQRAFPDFRPVLKVAYYCGFQKDFDFRIHPLKKSLLLDIFETGLYIGYLEFEVQQTQAQRLATAACASIVSDFDGNAACTDSRVHSHP